MDTSQTIWYLWAVNNDPKTNEYLVQVIGEQNPEHELKNKLCVDGQRRNLFRCPQGYDNVRTATAAIPKFGLKLEIFKESQGPNADKIVRYDLWKRSAKKAATKSKRMSILRRHVSSV